MTRITSLLTLCTAIGLAPLALANDFEGVVVAKQGKCSFVLEGTRDGEAFSHPIAGPLSRKKTLQALEGCRVKLDATKERDGLQVQSIKWVSLEETSPWPSWELEGWQRARRVSGRVGTVVDAENQVMHCDRLQLANHSEVRRQLGRRPDGASDDVFLIPPRSVMAKSRTLFRLLGPERSVLQAIPRGATLGGRVLPIRQHTFRTSQLGGVRYRVIDVVLDSGAWLKREGTVVKRRGGGGLDLITCAGQRMELYAGEDYRGILERLARAPGLVLTKDCNPVTVEGLRINDKLVVSRVTWNQADDDGQPDYPDSGFGGRRGITSHLERR